MQTTVQTTEATTRTRAAALSAAVVSVVTWVLVVLLLAAGVALAVVPKLLDGAALTVLTGSMVPTYEPGDVVVVRGVDDPATQVDVGDVVTFQPVSDDPTLVTHRVVERVFTSQGELLVTRGDANSADDAPIVPEQVKAVVVYSVPWVGHVLLHLGEQRSTVVVVVATALFLYAAVMILRPSRTDPHDGSAPARRRRGTRARAQVTP